MTRNSCQPFKHTLYIGASVRPQTMPSAKLQYCICKAMMGWFQFVHVPSTKTTKQQQHRMPYCTIATITHSGLPRTTSIYQLVPYTGHAPTTKTELRLHLGGLQPLDG